MGKMDEQILVVDRGLLFEDERLAFQGLKTDDSFILLTMHKLRKFFEVRRGDAENNPDWKQPISYVVIKRGDSIFLYERLKAGGESRLHNSLSIGVGGHMNMVDEESNWFNIMMSNIHKELGEELYIQSSVYPTPEIIGIINDDINEVGKVHIGILAVLELPEDAEVTVRETDKIEGYWIRIRDLKKNPLFNNLESWSQMAVEVL